MITIDKTEKNKYNTNYISCASCSIDFEIGQTFYVITIESDNKCSCFTFVLCESCILEFE